MLQPGHKFINLQGMRFGHLLIIKQAERPIHTKRKGLWWWCQCDCGTEKAIASSILLKQNGTKSCGCLARENTRLLGLRAVKDLTNQRFGRLVVIGRAPTPPGTKSRTAFWMCKCDCNKVKSIRTTNLTTGATISCGCYNHEVIRKSAVIGAATLRIYDIYKRMAESRNLEFNLSKDEFTKLAVQPCYYCGIQPQHLVIYRGDKFTYNGIDRVDNMQGYITSNSVPCCETCNKAKRILTVDEFRNWVIRIYSHWIERRTDEAKLP